MLMTIKGLQATSEIAHGCKTAAPAWEKLTEGPTVDISAKMKAKPTAPAAS